MALAHRMENALARAEELIAVGQQSTALQILYDAITSRHFQHNLLALDPIMHRFVELCVELRQGRYAKEGLSLYRSFSQLSNMQSFEAVIRKFIKLSEAKLSSVLKSAEDKTTATESEDPMVVEIAKMLQAQLAGETAKGSVDRETVLPWMRFLWEALRLSLEVCRGSTKVEILYSDLVMKSFDYCVEHQRKSELKRLAEMLRAHLVSIVKSASNDRQQFNIQLSGEQANPESQQIQLDIRYRLLDVALQMELWQEAFRAIEDIHGLFLLGGKSTELLLAREEYFEKVARILAMSDNALFYSAALLRQYYAADDSKKEELKNKLALSLLSVPLNPGSAGTSVINNNSWTFLDDQHARATRLAYILGLEVPPTISSLVSEVVELGVEDAELLKLLNVYRNLDFQSCDLAFLRQVYASIQNPSDSFIENLVYLYLKHLEHVKPLESFDFSCLQSELSGAFKKVDLFQLLTKWQRTSDVAVVFDMASGKVKFDKNSSLLDNPQNGHVDYEDPKVVFMLELCEALKAHSSEAFEKCQGLYDRLDAARKEAQRKAELAEKQRIEWEAQRKEKEREEAKMRAMRLQAEQEAESRRLAEEANKREQDRLAKEREAVRKSEQKKKEEEEKRLSELTGMRANIERLQHLSVRLDHIERALRQEELPLLEADHQEQIKRDQEAYNDYIRDYKESSKRAFEKDQMLKSVCVEPFKPEIGSFISKLRAVKESQFLKAQQEMDAQFEKAKLERIANLEQAKREKREREEAFKNSNLAAAIEATLTGGKVETAAASSWRRADPTPVVEAPVVSESSKPTKYIPPHLAAAMAGENKPAAALSSPVTPQQPPTNKYVPPHLKNRQ